MSQKAILVTILLVAMLPSYAQEVAVRSSASTPVPPSKFFSNFSPPDLLKDNSRWEELCLSDGGGPGGAAETTIPKKVYRHKGMSLRCQIDAEDDEKFKEKESTFFEALKSEVEKQVIRSGAEVLEKGNASPAGFYLEYREGSARGRLEIIGKRTGRNDYSFSVDLNEERKD